jgi:hypothetical protein
MPEFILLFDQTCFVLDDPVRNRALEKILASTRTQNI